MRKGSAHLVIILGVALAIIGGLIYYALTGTRKSSIVSTTTSTPTSTATPSVSVDPYAGWKEYTIDTQKLSFKYPSNWTITEKKTQDDEYKYVFVTGPDPYHVTIQIMSPADESAQGGSTGYNSSFTQKTVDSLELSGKQLYLNTTVTNGKYNGLYLSSTKDSFAFTPTTNGLGYIWAYLDGTPKGNQAVQDFNPQDAAAKEGILILKSLNYKPENIRPHN